MVEQTGCNEHSSSSREHLGTEIAALRRARRAGAATPALSAFTVSTPSYGGRSLLSVSGLSPFSHLPRWWMWPVGADGAPRKSLFFRTFRWSPLCWTGRHPSDGCPLQRPTRSTPPRADTAPPPSPGTASAPPALAAGEAPGAESRERPDAVPVHIRENNGRVQQTASMPRQACRLPLQPNVYRWRKFSPPGSHLSLNERGERGARQCSEMQHRRIDTASNVLHITQSGSPAFSDVRIPREPDMTAAHGEQHANVRFTSGAHRVHVNSMPRIWLARWTQPGWC